MMTVADGRRLRVTVRGFTKEGYQKDLAVLNHEQILMQQSGMKPAHPLDAMNAFNSSSAIGIEVDPTMFPEMVRFCVLVEYP
mgnify:CR=1 FL=1